MSPRRDTTHSKHLKPRPNPLDQAGIAYIDHKDTELLRKFVSLLPYSTGIKQQPDRRANDLVTRPASRGSACESAAQRTRHH